MFAALIPNALIGLGVEISAIAPMWVANIDCTCHHLALGLTVDGSVRPGSELPEDEETNNFVLSVVSFRPRRRVGPS